MAIESSWAAPKSSRENIALSDNGIVQARWERRTTEEISQITSRVRKRIKSILPVTDKEILKTGKYSISDFQKVVIIAGSSRGGTSIFFDTLRNHPDISSPDGEHGKYYTLNNVCYPFHDSDYIETSTPVPTDLPWFMLLDVGRTCLKTEETHYIDNFITRLPMQFFYRIFDFQKIRNEYLNGSQDLREIISKSGIIERYYDLKSAGLENAMAYTPLSDFYISETPFIFPHRNKRALQLDDFSNSTLLIKTSVDAYRLEWLKKLFPKSRLKIIHLTRNPAAAMNGLIDGWVTNRGFFTYEIPNLAINGYARNDLWNYDLPPNWKELRTQNIYSVVWNQWSQSHKHILNSYNELDVHTVKFENFLYNRGETIQEVLDFMGLSFDLPFRDSITTLKEVMATKKPSKYRWKNRGLKILDTIKVLDDGIVEELAYQDYDQWY